MQDIPDRGLDHGAYVPLVEMFPDADIPVLQISMPTLDPQKLMDIGRKLAPLRDEGVLIVGSGFFTHNLAALRHTGGVPGWSAEFDDWGQRALAAPGRGRPARLRAQVPGRAAGPPAHRALRPAVRHPGRGGGPASSDAQRSVIDGFWMGLAKRSVQFG